MHFAYNVGRNTLCWVICEMQVSEAEVQSQLPSLENTCTLLKVAYPIIYKDRNYLPTLEDVLKLFRNIDTIEDLCKKSSRHESSATNLEAT